LGFRGRHAWALVLGAVAATVLAACGGSTDASTPTEAGAEAAAGAAKPLPADAPMTKVLASRFPAPKVQPDAPPGSAEAIVAGRKACKGKTPVEVRDEFIGEAKASGNLNPGQEKMIAQLDGYEAHSATSPDFVAGQLAAGVYEATLPESVRIAGYQGCVYELARQLEKELQKKQK
jgi:hypothetical protein